MRIAAITNAFNEPEFLPFWVEHHGRQVGFRNLYVVTHGVDPRPRWLDRRVQVINVPLDEFDETRRARFMTQLQHFLLSCYDWVVMSDADELIVADPSRYSGLRDYLRKNPGVPTFNTVGLNVVQNRAAEAPLQPGRPLFRQRAYVQFWAHYCKPAVTSVPIVWSVGFHECNRPRHQTDDLYMIHLRAVDETIARRRNARLNALKMSRNTIDKKHSVQFTFDRDRYLKMLFPSDRGLFERAPAETDFRMEIEHMRRHPKDLKFVGPIARMPVRFADSVRLLEGRIGLVGRINRIAHALRRLRRNQQAGAVRRDPNPA
ncbi:glycosyltransferase family 2 protein [Prosthecodimorpha staleyi]|uniref:Glycosyltransferase family 2 protein n=1 Tax=Prosthecodimorpha staleyi TaxID=2840188 RepID=A0A947D7X4_9HYPH|nr:glycosyltransferase family 2 protein [Prosthecodimorpha staleyi]MBT9291176.1 glycosyltransferase family 2 protein [Prosthecodimorpha staleyi]